jgi:hypothetical protein
MRNLVHARPECTGHGNLCLQNGLAGHRSFIGPEVYIVDLKRYPAAAARANGWSSPVYGSGKRRLVDVLAHVGRAALSVWEVQAAVVAKQRQKEKAT